MLVFGIVLPFMASAGCTSYPVAKSEPAPYSRIEPSLESETVRIGNTTADSSSVEGVPFPRVSRHYSKPPKLKFFKQPVYPSVAFTARIEGTVVLSVAIDEEGHVSEVEAVSGHAMFHKAAIDAMRQCVFEPAQLDGIPVAVTVEIPLSFSLE